jgi:hypothetical protein
VATVTGSGELVAAAPTISRGPPSNTHLGVARAMLPAAEHIARTMENPAWATAFICGQITECLLRALLSVGRSKDPARGNPDLQHNLVNLWRAVNAAELRLAIDPPQWIEQINSLHHSYQLRYGDKYDVTVIPNALRLVGEVRDLLVTVERQLSRPQDAA